MAASASAPATSAESDATTPAAQPRATRPAQSGYLSADAVDMLAVLPAAPRPGEARYENDRRIFRETRALQGSPRWQLAADDADLSATAMLRDFSCSLDIELTPQQAPRLVQLLQKATHDGAQSMLKAKEYYKRQRPFWIDEGPICRPRDELGKTYDYPSGHTTAGWTWALALAQVAPEHATAIFARGRAIGDSRIVCGVHNASAVEAARLLTSAVMSLVTITPAYQQDLAAARAELAGLRAASHLQPQPARCAAEAQLIRVP
ncbi:MAG TPA: phosphatase PAP2 family protein [Steroidobacteraceae bacterium]|nr:phosphatase PAP2 family protein [Steroidobacteraceae bacterium]